MNSLLVFTLLLGFASPALAQELSSREKTQLEHRLRAQKISEAISIDGKLDESSWDNAPVASDFIQSEPKEGAPSAEQTEARVLYDSQNLYIGVYAHDAGVRHVVVSDLKKDFDLAAGDSFDVILDTFHDQRNGYIFSTNAAGAKSDAQMINEGRETNASWDGVWYVKTNFVDDGWIAEIAIPFKTLKFREDSIQTWGMNFHRNLRSNLRNEDSFWSPVPRIYDIQRVSLAGTLEGLEGIKPGSNMRFKPYVTSSVAQNGTTGARKGDADFGFDAKYGVTSGLTWDFTYNTDFSQVEADEQQVNLSRFSLFFPEKREFFLENSGIFRFGGGEIGLGGGQGGGAGGRAVGRDVFFFSRSIGISSTNEAVPILGGTRLTGRAGPYEIGLLNMQQRAYGKDGATNFTVGRMKYNLMANSDIGVLMMNKQVSGSSRFNRVFGSDANLRFGQTTTVYAFFLKSSVPGVDGDTMYGRLAGQYQDRTWQFKAEYNDIQSNFIDEMGYVPRRGIKKYDGEIRGVYRPKSKTVRQVVPHVVINYITDPSGHIDSKFIDYHILATLQNGASMEIGQGPTIEVLTKSFTLNNGQNIVPAGTYNSYEYFFFFRPDPSRRFQPNGRFAVGPFYTGYKHSYMVGENLRLNHKFNTSLSYTYNNISLADGRYKTHLLSTRVNYSFSTSVFLNALVQYNSDQRQWSSNIRFNVIHHPLSDFFLVYNERRDSLSGNLMDRALIAKVTYMFQR